MAEEHFTVLSHSYYSKICIYVGLDAICTKCNSEFSFEQLDKYHILEMYITFNKNLMF